MDRSQKRWACYWYLPPPTFTKADRQYEKDQTVILDYRIEIIASSRSDPDAVLPALMFVVQAAGRSVGRTCRATAPKERLHYF
jgi:hypothetical protein